MQPPRQTPPVGVALAGGDSRRMGRDKATLPAEPWGRGRMVDWTVERLAAVCDEVVVADAGRGLAEPSVAESVADGPGRGPASGILGAAAARPGRDLLVLAVDLPLVPPAFLERVASLEGDWVLPEHGGRLEPLASLFRPPALDALRRRVEAGRFDLHGLAESSLVLRRVSDGEIATYGAAKRLFANLNRPKDLERLRDGRF